MPVFDVDMKVAVVHVVLLMELMISAIYNLAHQPSSVSIHACRCCSNTAVLRVR